MKIFFRILFIVALVAIAVYLSFCIYYLTENARFEKEINMLAAKGPIHPPLRVYTEEKKLEQAGYFIRYIVAGKKGAELIIFLHPAFGCSRCFNEQVNYFASSFRVICLDLMGHGDSQIRNTKDRIDKSHEHIAAIIKREGYTKTHIAGVSMGALIAQYFALKHPDMVQSVIVTGGYDISADNQEIMHAQNSQIFKWLGLSLLPLKIMKMYNARVTSGRPDIQARMYVCQKPLNRNMFLVMGGMGRVITYRKDFKRCWPEFCMVGDGDMELARHELIKWQERDPGIKTMVVRNAGHCVNMEAPEKYNELVADFIKSLK